MFLRVYLFAIYAHMNTPRQNSLVDVELITAKDQTLRVFVGRSVPGENGTEASQHPTLDLFYQN
jgi:hypothetical protein